MSHERDLVRVGIGQLAVERGPRLLKATLGSCVGLAFLWREQGCFALAHCLLPVAPDSSPGPGARYVDQAVGNLLALMQVAARDVGQIEVYVAGGGNMMQRGESANQASHIGQLNIDSAMQQLARRGLTVHHADVGGKQARQMLLDCANGTVTIMRLPAPLLKNPDGAASAAPPS